MVVYLFNLQLATHCFRTNNSQLVVYLYNSQGTNTTRCLFVQLATRNFLFSNSRFYQFINMNILANISRNKCWLKSWVVCGGSQHILCQHLLASCFCNILPNRCWLYCWVVRGNCQHLLDSFSQLLNQHLLGLKYEHVHNVGPTFVGKSNCQQMLAQMLGRLRRSISSKNNFKFSSQQMLAEMLALNLIFSY